MQVGGVQDKSIIIFDILKSDDDERIMYLFFIINIIINYTYLFYYLQKKYLLKCFIQFFTQPLNS